MTPYCSFESLKSFNTLDSIRKKIIQKCWDQFSCGETHRQKFLPFNTCTLYVKEHKLQNSILTLNVNCHE